MIHAFVGSISSNEFGCVRGNGKTLSLTGYLLLAKLAGNKIFTNYYTDFSDMVDSCQNIVEYLQSEMPDNVVCGFTEFHNVINSIGTNNKQLAFINKFASQIRKLDVEALYDTQRYADIHIRMRNHTDTIFVPEKRHIDDLRICNNDRCKEKHEIYVYRYYPYYHKWLRKFNAEIIGKHYDTRKIVFDTLDKNVGDKND